MKASWNGYLSLGNLKVPVQLYLAVQTTGTQFVLLHADDNSPTGRAIKCLKEDKEIPSSETIRAVEKDGKYITISDSDMVASGEAEKILHIRQFSEPSAIKPKYYDKPYFVVPTSGGELAYTLLRQAFVAAKKIAIATYTYYHKEHIGLITVEDGILMLQQLRFASEIVPRSDIKMTSLPQPSPTQVEVAVKLIERYTTPFYVDDYRNVQQDRLNELVERKAKGLGPKRQKSVAPHATEEEGVVPALEELLKLGPSKHIPV